MKAHLVRIGNSRGVRLPKTIIAQAGLTDEVELGGAGASRERLVAIM
jgi:antitoxin component of MazEF toxin-antitoxin module